MENASKNLFEYLMGVCMWTELNTRCNGCMRTRGIAHEIVIARCAGFNQENMLLP